MSPEEVEKEIARLLQLRQEADKARRAQKKEQAAKNFTSNYPQHR